MDPKTFAITVFRNLLDFYGTPLWTNTVPALDELVSTILSQNTNDTNRDRAFQALKARFPTWEGVRDADVRVVIDTIRPAGLANQKGARIQAILRNIAEKMPADQPQSQLNLDFLASFPPQAARAWLMQFKGVGPKTAAIVMQFSLGMPAFPVDTHVYRVTGRLGLRPEKMNVEQAHAYLETVFPPETYAPAHLNIIRLGREICQARRPLCAGCPLQEICAHVKNR
jgi:endonuclease-3